MEKKFKILRFVGSVYKILGIISAVVTVIAGIGICLTSVLGGAMLDRVQRELGNVGPMGLVGGAAGGAIIGGVILLYGATMALLLYGIGEGIYLLLTLEENTRATAIYLQQVSQPQTSTVDYSPPQE